MLKHLKKPTKILLYPIAIVSGLALLSQAILYGWLEAIGRLYEGEQMIVLYYVMMGIILLAVVWFVIALIIIFIKYKETRNIKTFFKYIGIYFLFFIILYLAFQLAMLIIWLLISSFSGLYTWLI